MAPASCCTVWPAGLAGRRACTTIYHEPRGHTDVTGGPMSAIGVGMNHVDLPEPGWVDAHVHVWDRARHPQPWIDPVTMAAIDRDFDLPTLRADVGAGAAADAAAPMPRVVLVQTVPVEAETRDLLQTALDDQLV